VVSASVLPEQAPAFSETPQNGCEFLQDAHAVLGLAESISCRAHALFYMSLCCVYTFHSADLQGISFQ